MEKTVQGTYITKEAKEILAKNAKKKGISPTSFASEILEKAATRISKKERKGKKNE
jgi:hypothetical protein